MNDCFLKQYKRSIENSNLPKLDMIVLDYLNVGNTKAFFIRSGVNATHLKFKSNVHDGSATGSLVSEATVAAGQTRIFYFDASTPATESMVEIDNIYDIKIIAPYDQCLSFNPTLKTGLQSLIYNDNLLWVGGIDFELSCVPDGLKRLSIGSSYSGKDVNFDSILSKNNLQIINGQNPYSYYDAGNIFMLITPASGNNTSIRAIGTKIRGNIENLPVYTTCLYFPASTLTGSIESFITKARNAGRASGSIMFRTKSWSVTYNGTEMRNLTFNLDNPVFSWTENSITTPSSNPSEVTTVDANYKSQAAWQPLT